MINNNSDNSKSVLVTCATGKAGYNICRALVDDGFKVFGTTRGKKGIERLTKIGVTPIKCDYTKDLDRALSESGCKRLFFITDFFNAAKNDPEVEFLHGKHAVDAAKKAGVEHTIFMSVSAASKFPPECTHILAKPRIEEYLAQSGITFSVLGPVCFFENFDDPANWNPLKKGKLKFLMSEEAPFCATYDIGKAAGVQFNDLDSWSGKTLHVISWKGDLKAAAAALEKVSGVPVKHGLAMPIFARRLFLKDLHYMCNFFAEGGIKADPAEFKKLVPDAMEPEAWFRFQETYANGDPIEKSANEEVVAQRKASYSFWQRVLDSIGFL